MCYFILKYFYPFLRLGDQEHYLADEPIPVLPAPSGVRPPPLFQRFSMLAAEFAEPYDSNKSLPDLKQLLFQLYKGNPKLKYTPRVNTVRLIATGEVGALLVVVVNFFVNIKLGIFPNISQCSICHMPYESNEGLDPKAFLESLSYLI